MDELGFLENEMVHDAVIRNIEVIGEASHNILSCFREFVAEHTELPLAIAYQMRNVMAHGYFQVDLDVVWRTIQKDLTEMYNETNRALLEQQVKMND